MRGKGFGFRWYESSGPGPAGSGRQACFHQALRTEALRGISGQVSAATGANANGIHRQMFFLTPATEAISGKGYTIILDLGFAIYGWVGLARGRSQHIADKRAQHIADTSFGLRSGGERSEP
jgi:hypothetical protein